MSNPNKFNKAILPVLLAAVMAGAAFAGCDAKPAEAQPPTEIESPADDADEASLEDGNAAEQGEAAYKLEVPDGYNGHTEEEYQTVLALAESYVNELLAGGQAEDIVAYIFSSDAKDGYKITYRRPDDDANITRQKSEPDALSGAAVGSGDGGDGASGDAGTVSAESSSSKEGQYNPEQQYKSWQAIYETGEYIIRVGLSGELTDIVVEVKPSGYDWSTIDDETSPIIADTWEWLKTHGWYSNDTYVNFTSNEHPFN